MRESHWESAKRKSEWRGGEKTGAKAAERAGEEAEVRGMYMVL